MCICIAAILVCALGLDFFFYHGFPRLNTLLGIHSSILNAALLATFAAGFATIVVVLFRANTGTLEFSALGIRFQGPSGPILLWVVAFLAIAVAIRLFAGPLPGGNQETAIPSPRVSGPAFTTGAQSPAVTGNGNQITYGSTPEQDLNRIENTLEEIKKNTTPGKKRKAETKEEGQPFLVSVEWGMMSYGGGDHGTPFWFQYRSPGGCTLSPVQVVLFIHIRNLRNVPVTVIGYGVEAGFPLTRLPTTAGNIYSILPSGKSLLGAKIGDVINFTQGPGFSMVHFSTSESDFTHAMLVEMETLDNSLNKPLEPNVPIRGWAFFTYSSEKNFSFAGPLRIKLKTDELQTSSYDSDMQNHDSQWDVLKRPMTMRAVSDLSACARKYYSSP